MTWSEQTRGVFFGPSPLPMLLVLTGLSLLSYTKKEETDS